MFTILLLTRAFCGVIFAIPSRELIGHFRETFIYKIKRAAVVPIRVRRQVIHVKAEHAVDSAVIHIATEDEPNKRNRARQGAHTTPKYNNCSVNMLKGEVIPLCNPLKGYGKKASRRRSNPS